MALPSGKIGHTDLNADFVAVDVESGTGKYTQVLKNRANTSSELFSYPKASWIEDPSIVDDSLITTGVAYNALSGKAPTSHDHSTEDISNFGDWAVISDVNNNIVFKTLDIGNWTTASLPSLHDSAIRSVCYGNGKFVAVGYDGKIEYSSNGVTWTAVADSKFGTTWIRSVCYGDGKYVAANNNDCPIPDQISVYNDNPSKYTYVYRFITQ